MKWIEITTDSGWKVLVNLKKIKYIKQLDGRVYIHIGKDVIELKGEYDSFKKFINESIQK